MISLALASCIGYATRLQNLDETTEVGLDAYHAVCLAEITRQGQGIPQLSRCLVESGQVTCDWYTYGTQRLPFEPRVMP